MFADARFTRDYRLVGFVATRPYTYQSLVYVRTYSPRIGVRQDGERVIVPGFLLADGERAFAGLDEAGRMGAFVQESTPLRLRRIDLPPGSWRLAEVRASGGRPSVTVLSSERQQPFAADEAMGGRLDVAVRALSGTLHLQEFVFERLPAG